MAEYRPAGFHTVTPYLVVEGADRLLQFLKDAFDAEEIVVHRKEDRSILHSELRIGDSVVEMGEAQDPVTPMPACLHLYVPDTDAAYRKAIGAGAISLSEPADAPYGDRTAGVEDPSGNRWYLATFQFR